MNRVKPQEIYAPLYHNKDKFIILVTGGRGSGSIAIAADDMGYKLTGIELDPEYYEAAKNRLKEHQRQLKLF